MSSPCCSPTAREDCGCTSGIPATSLGRTFGGGLTKRHAWLERERQRLNKEVNDLLSENEKLADDLTKYGMPSGIRPDQIELDEKKLDNISEEETEKPTQLRLAVGAEQVDDLANALVAKATKAEKNDEAGTGYLKRVTGKVNTVVVKGSALGLGRFQQALIYLVALAAVIFVLVGTAFNLGGDNHNELDHSLHLEHSDDSHGGDNGAHTAEDHAGDHAGNHSVGDHSSGDHSSGGYSAEEHSTEEHTSHDGHATTAHPMYETGLDDEEGDPSEGHMEPAGTADMHGGQIDTHGTSGNAGGHHRRLSESPAPPADGQMMKSIAAALTGCGLIALTVNLLQQPLILGYLLGGVLVGPIGLGIVDNHVHIAELSSLGLVFLLFMIGLELDIKALLKMGKVVLLTGALQFPICAGVMIGVFMGLEAMGLNFGTGPYASMYCGMVCGISSTMIVVKVLGEKGETDSQPGRLTVGILIFQDIWAIVVLAIQPNLANPEILGILKTFGMIAVLVAIALAYAKFVMPAVLYHTSKNLELMLVMSLSWCFFVCVTAILPFVGLSMELASLIAGVALATFPYSAEFNGKIKYIRDFFITLFFAGLGMQIPVPSITAIAMGVLVACIVLIFRWLGIFSLVVGLGGGTKLGAISTINLSQISEFALVICSLGMSFGHINEDTMVIIIWTFAILAISASYLIGFNSQIYIKVSHLILKLRGKPVDAQEDIEHDHGEHRDIVLLGYHKVAFMLVAEVKAKSPQLLKRMHVIDFNQSIMPKLRSIGLECSYGDISSPDVLEHAHHGEPRIVISTIPDSVLRGTTNAGLVKAAKQVWPGAHIIVTADSPEQAKQLYSCGADYVLRMAKLCAERLHELLSENRKQTMGGGQLEEIFEYYKNKDKELRSAGSFVGHGTWQ